ncbi:uncharacterized protein LOC128236848 [Mya arenaria]|uniref:uncharacterized protein LOC128236848 n=1 Tax=Mya arenaria TaxID=6604 RepID=UPI0022E037F4|nr:uncharacterized protein LOC128236848 [Mya arenaria]
MCGGLYCKLLLILLSVMVSTCLISATISKKWIVINITIAFSTLVHDKAVRVEAVSHNYVEVGLWQMYSCNHTTSRSAPVSPDGFHGNLSDPVDVTSCITASTNKFSSVVRWLGVSYQTTEGTLLAQTVPNYLLNIRFIVVAGACFSFLCLVALGFYYASDVRFKKIKGIFAGMWGVFTVLTLVGITTCHMLLLRWLLQLGSNIEMQCQGHSQADRSNITCAFKTEVPMVALLNALALTLCIVVVVILTADVCCRRPRRLPEYVGMPMELVDFGPVVCPADSEEDVQRFRNKAGTSCDDGASTSNQPD